MVYSSTYRDRRHDKSESVTSESSFAEYYNNSQQPPSLQQQQSDNASITTSLFTAVDHLDDNDDDDDSEYRRHGYVAAVEYEQQNQYQHEYQPKTIEDAMGRLNINTQWKGEGQDYTLFLFFMYTHFLMVNIDYRPQYHSLDQSHNMQRREIYKEIYGIMSKMQELDFEIEKAKKEFQRHMSGEYEQITEKILSKCYTLSKEKEAFHKKSRETQGKKKKD
jgi:hypothetical protein